MLLHSIHCYSLVDIGRLNQIVQNSMYIAQTTSKVYMSIADLSPAFTLRGAHSVGNVQY